MAGATVYVRKRSRPSDFSGRQAALGVLRKGIRCRDWVAVWRPPGHRTIRIAVTPVENADDIDEQAARLLLLIVVASVVPTAAQRTHRAPQNVSGNRAPKSVAAYARRPEVHPAVHARVGQLLDDA